MTVSFSLRAVIAVVSVSIAACGTNDVTDPSLPGPPAFINNSAGTLAVRDANGVVIRTLDGRNGHCSRNAMRVVYAVLSGGFFRWEVSNIDGSNARQLNAPILAAQIGDAAWSPDGTRLAVTYISGGVTGIFLMNADGSGATQLQNAAPTTAPVSWSPDGTELLFVTLGANPVLRVMNIVTGTGRDVAIHPFQARWSPDGSRIGIVEFPVSSTAPWPITVINRDGTGRRLVTSVAGSSPRFTWTPNGRMLYSDNGTLTFLDISTGAKTPFPVAEATFQNSPHWCGMP